ncbi:MAG: DNA internalization-related competence protein ComEC/Rec2 [Nitrospirae bacterium]|nr:DNA internalization-related competence protein ComEC/Rec2 [Nitrospirota bacterium]
MPNTKLHPQKLNFNGVKGTGPLADGSEGRQGLPFYTNTGINATWYNPQLHGLTYLSVLSLSMGIFYAYLRYQPPLDPAAYVNNLHQRLVVEGTFISIPQKTPYGFKQDMLIKSVYTPTNEPDLGRSLINEPISVFYTGSPLKPATTAVVLMTLKLSRTHVNPGSYISDPRLIGLIKDTEDIKVHSPPPTKGAWSEVLALVEGFRYRMTQSMQTAFGGDVGGFLRSITIGDMSGLTEAINDDFRKTGLSHLLSISGTHFGMLFTMVFYILRCLLHRLPFRLLNRMSLYVTTSEIAAACALPVIGVYLLVSGLSVPALRSFIMASVFLIGLLLGLRGQWLNTIMLAAFIVELIDPKAIFTVSFQLSFVAVLFIGLEVHRSTPDEDELVAGKPASIDSTVLRAAAYIKELLKQNVLISLAATVGTMPIVLYYFHTFSVVTVLANLFVVPYTGFVVMPLMLFSAVSFVLFEQFVLTDVINWSTEVMLYLIKVMADLPFSSVNVRAFPLAFLPLMYVALILFYRLKDRRVVFASILLLAALLVGYYRFTGRDAMRVVFLDVGHGDGAVVETPGGSVVVIDTGKSGREVEVYLRYRGKDEIDAIVLSHADNDHTGGLFRLLDKFRVRTVLDNGRIQYYYNKPIDIRHLQRGDVFVIDGVSFTALHPYDDFYTLSHAATGNDASLVLKVSGSGSSFLFTGDVQLEGEEDLLVAGKSLKTDVLKVSHHGSRNATSVEFLQKVAPELAVISVGRDDPYGLPNHEVVQRLNAVSLYRTDRDGAILITDSVGYLQVQRYVDFCIKKVRCLKDELDNLKNLFVVY